jgi:signal transduction histidine kinase
MENLKNNSYKYAKTKVCINLEELSVDKEKDADHKVCIHFRDFGPGIADDEIPFVTGKFYRGKNSGNENGSGLGLYIVKELVGMLNGDLKIFRKDPGLEVVIYL